MNDKSIEEIEEKILEGIDDPKAEKTLKNLRHKIASGEVNSLIQAFESIDGPFGDTSEGQEKILSLLETGAAIGKIELVTDKELEDILDKDIEEIKNE